MEGKYKVLIDSQEFQRRILDLITTEELDKFFNCTVYAEEENSNSYKAAMIHGMCIASMMTSDCNQVFFVKEEINE